MFKNKAELLRAAFPKTHSHKVKILAEAWMTWVTIPFYFAKDFVDGMRKK